MPDQKLENHVKLALIGVIIIVLSEIINIFLFIFAGTNTGTDFFCKQLLINAQSSYQLICKHLFIFSFINFVFAVVVSVLLIVGLVLVLSNKNPKKGGLLFIIASVIFVIFLILFEAIYIISIAPLIGLLLITGIFLISTIPVLILLLSVIFVFRSGLILVTKISY